MAASAPGEELHSAVAGSMRVQRVSAQATRRLSATSVTTMIATGSRALATAEIVSDVTEAPTVMPSTMRAVDLSPLGGSLTGTFSRLAAAVASMAPVKAPPGTARARAARTPSAPTASVAPTRNHDIPAGMGFLGHIVQRKQHYTLAPHTAHAAGAWPHAHSGPAGCAACERCAILVSRLPRLDGKVPAAARRDMDGSARPAPQVGTDARGDAP